MDANAGEAYVLEMLDLSSLDYSLQWSPEEADLLSALATTTDDEPPPTAKAKQSEALRRHRQKKREEQAELKRAAKELEEKLHLLQQTKALRDILQPPTKWQALATNEARLRHEATVENKQLKERVQAHMVTVQTFASLLDKTWQQSKAMTYVRGPAEKKWEQLVLVADPTLRVRGMHAMLDRERARIESAFVEAGLIDVVDDVQKHVSQYTHNNSLEFHTILHRHTPLSLHALLEGTWNVLRGTVTIQNLPRYCKHLEDIDADTTYVSGWLEHPLGQFQRRVLCKQYVSEVDGRTQCIIVCRSIEDDELAPYDASSPHANEVSWTFMEANPSGGTTVKYFQKLRPSAWTASTPMSSHWADRLEEHSQKVRHAVHQYPDHFGATRPPQQ